MKQELTAIDGTATQIVFPNLTKAIRKEFTQKRKEFLNGLNLENDVKVILDKWYYRELLTTTTKKKDWSNDVKSLKDYLIQRYEARQSAKLEKELNHLQTVFNADDLFSITISMDWTKSRMWGNNPQAMAEVRCTNTFNRYESTRVGGCGYDKGSTAVADAINQSNSLLKAMYTIKDKAKNVSLKNHDVFGYGAGYGLLPRFEGGVGVSCYNRICNSIGFEFKTKASGKTFDVYEITKMTKKAKKSNY